MTSQPGPNLSPLSNPIAAETLRAIALHQETAVVLEFRARQAAHPAKADMLLRRARERRQLAERLREHLVGGPRRHPSAHI
jgi:hypothetical protein